MKAIGTDLVEVSRISILIEKQGEHFLNKIFTEQERTYCNSQHQPAIHFAARFAAKEALSKMLGTGIGKHASWLELEVLRNDQGAPFVQLYGKACERAGALGIQQIFLSISHTSDHALAFVVGS